MIPVGSVCPECHRIHLIKSLEELGTLSPHMRARVYRSEHRVFRDGYSASLDMNNEISHQLETWEFYEALTVWKLSLSQYREEVSESDKQQEEMEEIIDSDEEED